MHQVILNIIVTKYLDNKIFDHIDPWGETLESIAWTIRASYNRTIISTPGQAVFDRDMIFKLTSVVDWQVLTTSKQRQVEIDNVREKARPVAHDYKIGNQFYVEMTGTNLKLYYN